MNFEEFWGLQAEKRVKFRPKLVKLQLKFPKINLRLHKFKPTFTDYQWSYIVETDKLE